KTAAAAFAGAGYLTSTGRSLAQPPVVDLWAEAENIVRRVVAPAFPDRTFDITRYGATRDRGDATGAFRTAIDTCYAAGGGRVVVPAGRFVAGAIILRSGVNLHLENEAVVAFSRDPNAYLPLVPTRYEGMELMNYSPFIYAFNQERIAITGSG